MKKILLLALVLISTVSISKADFPFNVGAKVGYTSSTLNVPNGLGDEDNIDNFLIGAFARLNIGKKLYVQPEFYYASKGAKLGVTQFDMDSYNVPVLLGWKFINAGPFALRANAGPVFSFVSGKDIPKNVDGIKNNYTAIQYGVGVDFLMLTLDLAMENGGDISKSSKSDIKPSQFMVTLGWKFL